MKIKFNILGLIPMALLYAISWMFAFLDPVRTPLFIVYFFTNIFVIYLFKVDKELRVNDKLVESTCNIPITFWISLIACTYFFKLPWDASYSKVVQIVIVISGMIVEIIYKTLWRKKQIEKIDKELARYEQEYEENSKIKFDPKTRDYKEHIEYEYSTSGGSVDYNLKKSYYKY